MTILGRDDALHWMLGIEDTCVYPADDSMSSLDEHELTGHNEHWREDLLRARELGATAIRYGVSWPLVHIDEGHFEWDLLDEVIAYAVRELGLTIVADLVHYGTPRWLPLAFADARYPDAIESFAGEFAARYTGLVSHFTPLNEPVTTASFCGLRGVWPPYLSGWRGWVTVAVPMAEGIVRSIRAIRAAQPSATIVHVEASTLVSTQDSHLDDHVELLRAVGWLPTDLVLGRVNQQHPLREWLITNGASIETLDELAANPPRIDVMGVNYYPDLTPREITELDGTIAQVSFDRWTLGLKEAVIAFNDRYELPIVVSETSIEGSDELRVNWLRDSVEAVRELKAEGVDVRGYTWWPLMDFVDWSWAAGGANVEEFVVAVTTDNGSIQIAPAPPLGDPADGKAAFLRRMGLVRLEERSDGSLVRVETPAAEEFKRHALGRES